MDRKVITKPLVIEALLYFIKPFQTVHNGKAI